MTTILIGPPGAGCSSVARALAQRTGAPCDDLSDDVAAALGVASEFALVAVGEERYRECESEQASRLLERASETDSERVIALGSGCLNDAAVRAGLHAARQVGVRVIALTASVRCLASRNGLDAPRSVALGNVNHAFTVMLHERDALCRDLADGVVDTTDLTPDQAADALK